MPFCCIRGSRKWDFLYWQIISVLPPPSYTTISPSYEMAKFDKKWTKFWPPIQKWARSDKILPPKHSNFYHYTKQNLPPPWYQKNAFLRPPIWPNIPRKLRLDKKNGSVRPPYTKNSILKTSYPKNAFSWPLKPKKYMSGYSTKLYPIITQHPALHHWHFTTLALHHHANRHKTPSTLGWKIMYDWKNEE